AIEVVQRYLDPEMLLEALADITDAEGVPTELICLSALVEDAIQDANSLLYERNSQAKLQRFMGTTIVGLVPVKEDYMLWFHVGDSRIYRCRDAALKQLTSDHSAHTQWERSDRQGAEPAKNIITRAIGPNKITAADIDWGNWQKDDIYILCSDGLSDMLTDDQILQIINAHKDVDQIATQLIDAANKAGGKDNVSVVVCRV
ncbi:PP2C family protein-serine/threonine phosphatase, partial [Thermodesulfobacteriota bacterium]